MRQGQLRRGERVDSPADEEQQSKGRYFQADCQATDQLGHYVHITGPLVAGVRQVTRVDILDRATMPTIGVIVEKSAATRCLVQTFGEIPSASPLDMTRPFCWVGFDAKITQIVPMPAAGGLVVRQIVGQPFDENSYMIAPQLPPTVARG